MLRVIGLSFLMLLPSASWAKQPTSPEVRAVQDQSTDVFQVLQTLAEANAALSSREFSEAQRGFESVLMHDPTLKPARMGLRRCLIALGDYHNAETWIDDQNSVDALIIRTMLSKIDNPEKALKAKLQQSSDPRLWVLLGRMHDHNDKPSEARQAYSMAGLAGARPGLAENNIGQSHWMHEEYSLALDAFEKAVILAPSDIQFDNNRRRALIALGQTPKAVAGLGPERAGHFLAQAGDQAVRDGELRLARLLYKKSLDLSPRHNPRVAEKLAHLE